MSLHIDCPLLDVSLEDDVIFRHVRCWADGSSHSLVNGWVKVVDGQLPKVSFTTILDL